MEFSSYETRSNPGSEPSEEVKSELRKSREQVEQILERIDSSIGKGTSAEVFIEEQVPHICFKIIHTSHDEVNPISEEMRLLNEACQIKRKEIKLPLPLQAITAEYEDKGFLRRSEIMVMERINGWNLEEIVRKKVPFSLKDLDELKQLHSLFLNAEEFIQDLNKLGIFHNDLRLRNFMLDEEGHLWIIDFGRATKDPFPGANERFSVDVVALRETRNTFLEFAKATIDNN